MITVQIKSQNRGYFSKKEIITKKNEKRKDIVDILIVWENKLFFRFFNFF